MIGRREAAAERARQVALGRIDWPEVAIIGDAGDERVIACAARLRRGGVITSTTMSGNRKRMIQKAIAAGAEYLLHIGADGIRLEDRITGEDQEATIDTVLETTLDCLIYDWRIAPSEWEQRR